MADVSAADLYQKTPETTPRPATTPIEPGKSGVAAASTGAAVLPDAPVLDSNIPPDIRATAPGQPGAPAPTGPIVGPPAVEPAVTPAGGVQVAPTGAATSIAADAVRRGVVGSRETDPLTAMPKEPRPTIIPTGAVPHTDPDLSTAEGFQKRIDDTWAEGKRAGYLDESGKVIDRAGQLEGQDRAAVQAWADRASLLKTEFEARKEKLGWAEAAETFGHALSRIGAGLYGMRTGYDLSGMKFDSTDWSKRYDQAFGEYRLNLDDAEKQQKEKSATIQRLRQEFENWRGGLKSQQEAKDRADQAVDFENKRVDEANTRFLFDATKMNYEELNKFKLDYFNKEIAEAVARIKRSREISPADEKMMGIAADAYKKDSDKRIDETVKFQNALLKLEGLQYTSGKDYKKERDEAYQHLGAAIDPKQWAAIKKEVEEEKGYSPFDSSYDKALAKVLRNKGAAVYPKEPDINEYFHRYGVGVKLGATGTVTPTQKTVTARDFSEKLNKTRITYSDGTTELKDGKQLD